MKKQLQLFLTRGDEEELSRLLKAEIPGIQFLNDNVWPESPDRRSSIEDCESGRVYLYCGLVEQLPVVRRKDGQIEGPIAGCVIQFLRSLEKDGTLLSGRIAVGAEDSASEMRDFVSVVWKCVERVGAKGVVRPDGAVDNHFLVGRHARQAVADRVVKIADRLVGLHYEPAR